MRGTAYHGQHEALKQIRYSVHRKELGVLLAVERHVLQEHYRIIVPDHMAEDHGPHLYLDYDPAHAFCLCMQLCIRETGQADLPKTLKKKTGSSEPVLSHLLLKSLPLHALVVFVIVFDAALGVIEKDGIEFRFLSILCRRSI